MNITGNGTYKLHSDTRRTKCMVYVGASGGATVTLQYKGVALVDGVLAADSQYIVEHGRRFIPDVVVTGFTVAFDIDVTGDA